MNNTSMRNAFIRIMAGVSTLVPAGGWADEVITGNRTIYNGSDISGNVWLSGGHLRYGTVGVEDTLQPNLVLDDNQTGTLSVTATSTLHVKAGYRAESSTLNLGSAVDTGTIIFDNTNFSGHTFGGVINVNGGTVIANNSPYFSYRELGLATGSLLQLSSSGLTFVNLTGGGTLSGTGGRLTVSGGNFTGTIKDVGTLAFGKTTAPGHVIYGQNTVFRGRLINVNAVTVGYGSNLDASVAATAIDFAQVGAVQVDGKLDFGLESTTLNSLTGGGETGTGGSLTVNGSTYGGRLEGYGGLIFAGANTVSGTMAGNVTVLANSSLSTSNTSAFDTGYAVTINGVYDVQTSTSIGTLSGTGAIQIEGGQNLTIGDTSNSSFSGHIDGAGGLIKNGSGTLTLTGVNTYSGGTTIFQGKLIGDTTSLSGNISNYSELVFDQTTDGVFLGTLSGYGQLTKKGAGKLTLTGNSPFYGQTTISAGSLSANSANLATNIVNNASLIFDQNFNGTFAAAISGTGSVRKLGTGKLILSGNNTYTGSTFITEGTLSVNGMLSSDVLVQTGAKLGGSGTVGSFTAETGSFVTPGNSIGTLNVAGNATFANGSTYVVEANAAGASDRVNATGQAVIGPTAAVYVTSETGIDTGAGFPQSQTYRIVTAAGGISGTFGSVTDNFAYLVPTLSYDANNVYVTLTRESFVTGSNPPNANDVAGAVDQLGPGTIYNAVLFMNNADKPNALRSLAGELHPSVQRALMDGTSYSQSALLERLANGSDQPFWTSGVTGRTNYRATATTFGLVQDTNTILAGADVFDTGGWRAGILGGYGTTRMSLSDINATAKVDTFQAGVYGSYTDGGLGLRYGAISAVHQISTSRGISFSTLSENENANYLAFTQQVFAEASYRFSHDNGYLEPFLGITALYQDSQPFRESGGAAALNGQATSSFNQVIDAGVRFKQGISLGDVEARLVGKLGWQHTFGRNAFGTNASIGGSNAFGVSGLNASRDLGIVEAGIGFDLGKGLDVSLQYRGAFGKSSSSSAFNARLSASF